MQLADFLKTFDSSGHRGAISPLWRDIINSTRHTFDQLRSTGKLPAELPDDLHYDFQPVNSSTLRRWRKAEALAKDVRQAFKRVNADLGDLNEDVAALMFLRAAKLLDDYYAVLRDLGRAHDMQAARQFYYATSIRDWVTRHHADPIDVLEIGAGAGVLARLLDRMELVRSYTIVDIPPMLAMCGAALEADGKSVTFETPDAETKFRLLLPDTLSSVADGSFDLAININSFPEMDSAQVETYLSEIGRTARSGAILYTVNRIQTHEAADCGTWHCNPIMLNYPAGEVLFHQPDPFQTFTRALARMPHRQSFAMTRVARIQVGGAPRQTGLIKLKSDEDGLLGHEA